ncbi:MAG: MarR family transcriptional regulator [Betaproteobacteria bacterium]|nr:MarR family transcriptional regulator [Betaproteobacteria bacterium]
MTTLARRKTSQALKQVQPAKPDRPLPAKGGRSAGPAAARKARASTPPAPATRDLRQLLGDAQIGHEARSQAGDHLALRVWLRLLSCSTQIERDIRKRLRDRFDMSLARFDYLAQLYRHGDGLRMSQLSRYLMVTGANVTLLTDELVAEGLVSREDDPKDRRSFLLRLTAAGRKTFQRVAAVHEQWVIELLGGLGQHELDSLYQQLGRLRLALSAQTHREGP